MTRGRPRWQPPRRTQLPRSRRLKCRKETLPRAPDYWSARHRKIAIGGWLAFVVIAFVLGGAIGTKALADEDTGNGSSRVADTAINRADFPDKADEQVLVQARGGRLTVDDPRSRPASTTSSRKPRRRAHTDRRRVAARRGQRGPDLRGPRAPRSSRSSIPGDERLDEKRVDADARRHRGRAEGAPRPADRAVRRRQRRQGARRLARRRLQAGRVPLAPDHADHPDRRLRRAGRRRRAAAAGDHGRDRHARPGRPDQPDRPDGGVRELA